MPRARTYIQDLVAARIDELVPTGDNIGGQTGIEASYPKIEEELDLAAWWILQNAPEQLLFSVMVNDLKHFHTTNSYDSVIDIDTRIVIDSKLIVTVVLPDNFLRFVRVKLNSWTRPVEALLRKDDPKYAQLFNKYNFGDWRRPYAALVPFSSYSSDPNETLKRTIDQTLTASQTLSGLYNGQTPSGGSALTTGDIIVLTGQTDKDENGVYVVQASGAPQKVDNNTTTVNCKRALHLFRAKTASDTLEELFYIPSLKAEEMPDELIDALVDETAYRVFRTMGRDFVEMANISKQNVSNLLGVKVGLKGE